MHAILTLSTGCIIYIPFQTGRQAGGEQLFDPLASPSSPGAKEQAKDTKIAIIPTPANLTLCHPHNDSMPVHFSMHASKLSS